MNKASAGKRPVLYVEELRALQAERPFLASAMIGFLLEIVAYRLHGALLYFAIAMHLAGRCLLVYAVARRLQIARWINRRKWMMVGLWLLSAAASAMLFVHAFNGYTTLQNPDTWLHVESQAFPVAETNMWLREGYYLINLDPDSMLEMERVGMEGTAHGPVRRLLDRQIEISQELGQTMDFLELKIVANQGPRTISSLQLNTEIVYNWNHRRTVEHVAELPANRQLVIPIGSLRPDEDFVFVAFSTNPDITVSGNIPNAVQGQLGNEPRSRKLDVIFPKKGFARNILTSGVNPTKAAAQPVSTPH